MIYAINSQIRKKMDTTAGRTRLYDDLRDYYQRRLSSEELLGRQSGSLEWRQQRNELGLQKLELTSIENELIRSK
jgi:hypothetical protein